MVICGVAEGVLEVVGCDDVVCACVFLGQVRAEEGNESHGSLEAQGDSSLLSLSYMTYLTYPTFSTYPT